MVRVETDVSFLNSLANSDDVRPFIRPDGAALDFAPIAGKRMTEIGGVVLSNGSDAAAIFDMTADGVFQSHTLFGPTCRGRRAIEQAREFVGWMFDHGARVLWGSTPRDNAKARWFNRQIGARVIGGDDADELFEIRKAA